MKLRDVVIGANASMYYRLDFNKIKGVYYPRTENEVAEAIHHAIENGYDVTAKGGGSGLSGACTGGNRERIIISSLKMNQILSISKDQGYLEVQAGATPDEMNALLENMRMRFWVSPSSSDIATVGGLLSTDGGGNDAWVNGTMRDNTLKVKLLLYDGRKITVDWNGVKSDDSELEAELNKRGMTIADIAAAHGTLGFVTELRVAIRPIIKEKLVGGLVEYNDPNAMGAALTKMIQNKSPVRYGEAIIMAHPDIIENLNPPLLILEFPEDSESSIESIVDYKKLTWDELADMKDLRLNLPKRNPKSGIQVALFEGYGFHGKSLLNMGDNISEIDSLLIENDMVPFAKYGHGPSKWYPGDNTPAYGIIMHSREIKPENKTGTEVFKTVLQIVEKCEELGITPKPEHKWPFSDEVKKARIQELREVLGGGFNDFIFEPECNEVLAGMVS